MAKLKPLLVGLVGAGVLAASGYGLYTIGMQRGMGMATSSAPSAGAAATGSVAHGAVPQSVAEGEDATRRHIEKGIKAGDVDPTTGRKILYYHDPMVPGNKFDKPGKSPFMDMMMVPVYADGDAGSDGSKVTVSPRIQQNLGVRTAEVTEGLLSPQVSAVGNIAFNERDQAFVQARATGYIERLHVRATLDRVSKGQPLAELYVPDWIAAQEEFLSVRRMQGTDLASLVDGARQRLAGLSIGHVIILDIGMPVLRRRASIGGYLITGPSSSQLNGEWVAHLYSGVGGFGNGDAENITRERKEAGQDAVGGEMTLH